MKTIKGEKYIYLLMAYTLAKASKNKRVSIGKDTGMKSGFNFQRSFSIQEYDDKILLVEKKSSPHFADYSRAFEIIENNDPENGRDYIYEYITESGENASTRWEH